jgi:cell filamentation protein
MKNDYSYIDPDYTYTDPQNDVMRNRESITDAKVLLNFESFKSAERLEELAKNPISIKDARSLLAIHRNLFQDVYHWAGKVRTVNISKAGKPFIETHFFDTAFTYIDTLIAEYRASDKNNLPLITQKLAELLDAINFLHPFREGNGRTQREFIRTLALEKGVTVNLNPPDNADVYNRYMSGTIDGDVEKLAALISEWAKTEAAHGQH